MIPLYTKSSAVLAAELFCMCAFLQRIFPRQLIPQAVVDALLCQQLVVGAGFHDALFAQHKDAVVVLDGGQAVVRVVRPWASFSRLWPTRISLSLSSALVASSRMRMGGFFRNTRAMAMRCFCPPESLTPRSPT